MNRIEIDASSKEYQIVINGVDVSSTLTEFKLQCIGGYSPTFETSNKPTSMLFPSLTIGGKEL